MKARQLGEHDLRGRLQLRAIARGHQIDPGHAARPARGRPVFLPGFAQRVARVAKQLAHERALAHAGGIRLHHAPVLSTFSAGQPEPTGA